MFEKVATEYCTYTLMQNILNFKHVIDSNNKSLIIALGDVFQPFGLFRDAHSKEYTFSLFYGHPRPSLACSYQKIVQA
jgi:hypothetical protein